MNTAAKIVVLPPLTDVSPADLQAPLPFADSGRWQDGKAAMLDSTDHVPALWGSGDEVAWAEGEPLMLVGPDGIGKTTLGQQLALCRVGIRSTLLGYPVSPAGGKVLYVAADRPKQAIRSMRRMVTPDHYEMLEERLVVWKGPLPETLAANQKILVQAAEFFGASDVVIDSLKDVQVDLTKDEVGARANVAFQELIASERELLTLHHQRKQMSGGAKPRTLADVYGSRWLTAGQGSVFMLWGEPGDLVVDLLHLKQPVEDIGPLTLVHDHAHGSTSVHEGVDLVALIKAANNGLSVQTAAVNLFTTAQPDRNQIEKTRRRLESIVKAGLADRRTVNGIVHYLDAQRLA